MMKRVLVIVLGLLTFTAGWVSAQEQGLIACSHLSGDYWQIWLVAADGAGKQLTTSPSDKRQPLWLAGEDKLLCRTNNEEFLVINKDGSGEQQILKELGHLVDPDWSAVHNRLAFTRYDSHLRDTSEIWTADLAGKQVRVLTNNTKLQYHPSWSPDGESLAFVMGEAYSSHNIWLMNSDGSGQRQLTNNEFYNILPRWSPDGKRIVFASNRSGDYEIWLMNTDGTSPKQLTHSPGLDSLPIWSPDGKTIVFVSNRSGRLQLWTMDINSEDVKQLTSNESESSEPAWLAVKE